MEPDALRFGLYELDLRAGELRKEGILLRLQPQGFRVLACLASRPGDLVTREELKKELWGDESFVDFERGLNSCILLVRSALGDDAQNPRFIGTVPRRGYRFLAPVTRVGGEERPAGAVPEPIAPAAALPPPAEDTHGGHGLVPALVGVGIVLVAAFVLLVAPRWREDSAPATPRRAMLAVLPFESLDALPTEQPFADAITEELITRLGSANPRELGVIARTSVMRYKPTPGAPEQRADIRRVGRELGVDHVLEGSVRRAGGRIRITAQLIRVNDQTHVWAETYDRDLGDAIAIQDDVAARVAHAVSPRFTRRAPPAHVPDAAAHEAYLQGRAFYGKGTPDALRSAVASFEEATTKDPEYAAAHAALSEALHVLRMRASLPPRDVYPKAEAAARRALALDASLPDAHTALAAVFLFYHWDLDAARAELRTAIELNPSDAGARHDYAFLVAADDPEEAERSIRAARDLDPLSPRANVDVGWLYLRLRKDEAALAQCRSTLELEPGFTAAEACIAQACARLGRNDEALAFTRKVLAAGGVPARDLAELDGVPAAEALLRARRLRLRALLERARTSYVGGYSLAVEQAALGEKDAALASLENAFGEREPMLFRLDADPAFDVLREEPRFTALVKRVRAASGPTLAAQAPR